MELTPVLSHARRDSGPRRGRLRHQLGMTLIELLVTMTILATITGSIAGAFAIGFHVLNPGAAPAKLTGNNDLIAFEQQIGADINQAVCLASPGPPGSSAQTPIPTGGCTNSVQKNPSTCGAPFSTANPTGYLLCLAWYVPGSTTCHTVTYSQMASSGVILRTDTPTGLTGTSARLGTGGLSLAATWTPTATTTNAYQWTLQVKVAVTQQGANVVTPEATTFYLAPLVADPLSPAVPGTSIPC
jgi:prepilin-type N-terminal cleavage/methylation domain-containing protein